MESDWRIHTKATSEDFKKVDRCLYTILFVWNIAEQAATEVKKK